MSAAICHFIKIKYHFCHNKCQFQHLKCQNIAVLNALFGILNASFWCCECQEYFMKLVLGNQIPAQFMKLTPGHHFKLLLLLLFFLMWTVRSGPSLFRPSKVYISDILGTMLILNNIVRWRHFHLKKIDSNNLLPRLL